MEKTARTKLADRPVTWTEKYTERTALIKEQFDAVVGEGSYFRFEGRDSDTSDEYYAIIGPAGIRKPKAQFFAGVRKLPADYAAGGLYFSELREAAQYARDTWGIPIPSDLHYYDTSSLKGIGAKVKEWRKAHADKAGENGLDEDFDTDDSADEKTAEAYVASDEPPYYRKVVASLESLAQHRRREKTGYFWFDLDDIMAGADEDFEREKKTAPWLENAKEVALNDRASRRSKIERWYGPEYVNAGFYHLWLTYKPGEGTYLVAVSPYLPKEGNPIPEAQDKFFVFVRKLTIATPEEIEEKIESLIHEYADKFGVDLDRSDLNVPVEKNPFYGEITVKPSGRQKIYGSDEWKQKIMDYYGVSNVGKGMVEDLNQARERRVQDYYATIAQPGETPQQAKVRADNRRKALARWKVQLDQAYRAGQASGEAFMRQQPPPPDVRILEDYPPDVRLGKRSYGQQQFTGTEKTISTTEGEGQGRGFNSMREAVDYLNANIWAGAPISSVPNITSEDLRRARIAKESGEETSPVQRPAQAPSVSVPPRSAPATVQPGAKPKEEKKPVEKKPEEKAQVEEVEAPEFDIGDIYASVDRTVLNLVKLSEDLDAEGKCDQAEEIHKILRKHVLGRKS